jgi:hypothetical protein
MAMYPNMMQPIPFMKHKSKHPSGTPQEKSTIAPEKNEENEQKKENNNENDNIDSQNQMQEEQKQE